MNLSNFHPILLQFLLQSVHLYELLMDHTIFFFFKTGSKRDHNSEILHIRKVYRISIFHPILMCYLLFNELSKVLSVVCRHFLLSFTEQRPFKKKLKSYFNGLQSNNISYLKMNTFVQSFSLKSRLHWTLNTHLHMNNQVSDTDSSECLVYCPIC